MVKKYGYHTVQDFNRVYNISKTAYVNHMDEVKKWQETYGAEL